MRDVQGQGGLSGAQGRQDAGGVGDAVSGASEPDLDWKQRLVERADELFAREGRVEPETDIKALHAKIGQLSMENDFLSGALGRIGEPSAKR